MATVTPIYTNPHFNMVRAYVSGFVGSVGMSNMILSPGNLDFDYLAPLIHVRLTVTPEFQPPSSNCYTLDHVFDFTTSEVTLSGAPIDAGVGVKFVAMHTEATWRIQVLATLAADETVKSDLLPLSAYWRPIAP